MRPLRALMIKPQIPIQYQTVRMFKEMIILTKGRLVAAWLPALLLLTLLLGCGRTVDVAPEQFAQVDQFVSRMLANVAEAETLTLVADIDHARLGAEVGSPMAPTRVVLFSDPDLEAALFALNPLTALDMPLRVLAFAPAETGPARVIFNSFDYVVSRYKLDADDTAEISKQYDAAIATAMHGIPESARANFPTNRMQPDGIVTIVSPFAFDKTVAQITAAIDAQDDTMHFGTVSFLATDESSGGRLLLFGAPGPGAKGMQSAQTLGLDGFCQKFLVWQNDANEVFLAFNDLLALAERQRVGKSLSLRVIDYRLNSVFEDALRP